MMIQQLRQKRFAINKQSIYIIISFVALKVSCMTAMPTMVWRDSNARCRALPTTQRLPALDPNLFTTVSGTVSMALMNVSDVAISYCLVTGERRHDSA